MERPTEPATAVQPGGAPAATALPAEPVQRWRLTFARDAVGPDDVGRVALDAWSAALAGSGLPLAGLEPGGPGRARFSLGAPLPAAAEGRAELADIWLLERRPAWAVREALQDRLPPAHFWVGLDDVWLGAPALPGQVAAAVWTVRLAGAAADPARIDDACRRIREARSLPRVRARAGGDRAYDLRPLLADVHPVAPHVAGRSVALSITTRFDPALGSGRPEEVVAALADQLGAPLAVEGIARERLVLADPRPKAEERPVSSARRPRR